METTYQTMPTTRRDNSRIAERLHSRTTVEAAIRFAQWADQRSTLTAEEVSTFLQCSRANAYRWLRAFKDARGMA